MRYPTPMERVEDMKQKRPINQSIMFLGGNGGNSQICLGLVPGVSVVDRRFQSGRFLTAEFRSEKTDTYPSDVTDSGLKRVEKEII